MLTPPNWPGYLAAEKGRLELFLRESDHLAGVSRTPPIQISKGHFAALSQSQIDAYRKRPLSVERVKEWVKGMSEGNVLTEENQNQLFEIVEKILNNVQRPRANFEVKETVTLMGWILSTMASTPLFEEDKGRLARLLVNYVATWHQVPVFTFEVQDLNSYQEMCSSEQKAKTYLSRKVQEAVFDHVGRLLTFKKDENNTSLYTDDAGHTLLVEWHALFV